MRSRLWLVMLFFAAGCTCGKKDTAGGVTKAPEDQPGIPLAPPPLPPEMPVDPNLLPGAGEDLEIVVSRPSGEVRQEVRPTVTFNRPVKALEVVEAQRAKDAEAPFATIDPPLEGAWRWLGSASAEYVPKGLVPYSTSFTVTIKKGLRALDGAELKADHTFTFTTPVLELQDTTPRNGDRWLTPDQKLSLLFNQPVKDEELVAGITLTIDGVPTPPKLSVVSKTSIQDERRAAIEAARKEKRPYAPMTDEDRGWRNQQMRYVLAFSSPLPLDKGVHLTFSPTLHGSMGPLPGAIAPLEYRTYGPLVMQSARFCRYDTCPYGPLTLYTSNLVDLPSLKGKLKVTPAVEIDWDAAEADRDYEADHYVSLPGHWRPGTEYTIELAAGVADVFKQVTGAPSTFTARTADLRPSINAGSSLALVEAGGKAATPVEVSNIKQLDVKLWRVSIAELAGLVSKPEYEPKVLTRAPDLTERENLTYQHNTARVHPVSLDKLFGGLPTGMALLAVSSPQIPGFNGRPAEPERQLVQVTDLATHVKLGPKASTAWVTRLSTGEPVAEADVTIFDATGTQRWVGRTNAEGFAQVPGAASLGLSARYDYEYPFALVVGQKEGDLSFTATTWSSGVEPHEFQIASGWEGEQPRSASMAFTDRGIYKPGDEVYLKGLVRYRVLGGLKTPGPGSMARVEITDSAGKRISDSKVKLTKYGSLFTKAQIPKTTPTGTYEVEITAELDAQEITARTTFRVEEYRAPQFRVDVEVPKKELLAGDKLEGAVFARYLFGGGMSDAAASWNVFREATVFAPASGAGFTFMQQTWWWDDSEPEYARELAGSGHGRLDAKGSLSFSLEAVEAPGERPYTYIAEAEVTDVNRQAVAGRNSLTVHPARFYVGLRSPQFFIEKGKAAAFEALVVDATSGQRAVGQALEVIVANRTWKSVRKKDATGGFTAVSEPVETEVHKCSLTSASEPVKCSYTPSSAGLYLISARVKDEQGRSHSSSLGVYATGGDWVAWQRDDTQKVELLTDKDRYEVGDVARVLIKSPYPTAKAMFTVEREGVLERRLLDLKGSVTTVEVRVTEDMVPNVFAGVVLVRARVKEGGLEPGDDPGRPAARIGLVKVPVARKTKSLSVKVTTDKPDYRPREAVKIDVGIVDAFGKPADGEVTVYVVDEAVLRLTAYATPDPVASIFPERPLSVRLGEPLLHLVRRRAYGEKAEDQGGGGGSGEGAGFRTDFKTTVYFNPAVETANGHASVSFNLPDNLTAFRVMAVVVTKDDRFGSGEVELKVNKPLMALPALPRFARVGDTFEAGVVVHARGGGAGEVTVTAEVQGGAELTGPATQKVNVAPGAPKEVRFPFMGAKAGPATFRFKVQGAGDASDGVQEILPVELPVEIDVVATSGDTTDSRVEGIVPPKDVHEDLGGLDVQLASTSLVGLGDGFQQLIDYPFGCLEQQTSRLVPFIALREIAGHFGVPWPGADKKKLAQTAQQTHWLNTYLFRSLDVTDKKHPDDVIKATVASIVALEHPNGGFRYWASSECPSAWASAYATMTLHRAKEIGFEVPSEVLSRSEAFLGRVAGGDCSCDRFCSRESRAFAAYVLARMRKPKPSVYQDLLAHRGELTLLGKTVLMNAMFIGGGDKVQSKALFDEILNHAKESPQGVHLEEANSRTYVTTFGSDTRTTGVVLQALTDVSPGHPYVSKMASYLMMVRKGNGRWRTTQEAAFSLLALTQVMRAKERDVPDFKAKVAFGAASIIEREFKGRSLEPFVEKVPMKTLLEKAGGADQKLTFSKSGPGVLYYLARLSYAPKALPTQALDNGLFVQRWFEPYAGGGQTKQINAGELVRVRVRVASRQERHWVAIEAPLPAGLEPVDTTLATNAQHGPEGQSREEGYDEEGSEEGESGDAAGVSRWAYQFFSPFNHTELRDNRVVLFADHLPPGVHIASFVARATTPGKYILKPAKGELMYEPEVWGRSEGGSFEVMMPPQVSVAP